MGQVHARQSAADAAAGAGAGAGAGLHDIGAQVTKVHVDGLSRTRDDVVSGAVRALFNARHFEDVVMRAQEVRSSLQHLGCFAQVEVHIDTAQGGGPADYEVTFNVLEAKRLAGSVSTMVGNQEGSLAVGVRLPNVQGRGERVQVEYNHGTKKSSNFTVSYLKPFHQSGSAFEASVYQQLAECPPSGFKEMNRGLLLDFAFSSAPQIRHNLQWEAAWRDLSALNRTAAFAVREHSGHTLKSALRHIFTVDRLDNPVFPTEGTLLKVTQEYAGGLGGDVGFFKNQIEVQANVPLAENVVLQGKFHAGLITQMLADQSKSITVADRFFLGGPLNVRGFDLRGLGPSSDGCALGGNMFWASGLHIYTPLPFRPGRGGFGDLFRTHVFVTAGNLLPSFEWTSSPSAAVELALANLRLSYGLGLALKLGGIARVELNYCLPVKFQRSDKPSPGFQFGVGVEFL